LFSALGGSIGVALFEKRKGQGYPPPPTGFTPRYAPLEAHHLGKRITQELSLALESNSAPAHRNLPILSVSVAAAAANGC
jgi:hypothetical protein